MKRNNKKLSALMAQKIINSMYKRSRKRLLKAEMDERLKDDHYRYEELLPKHVCVNSSNIR
jgi:hypothetical protein